MKTITTTLDIDATPQEVWATLTDFASHQRWNPFFARVDGEAVVGSTLKINARKPDGSAGIGFSPTVLEVEPGSLLRWKGKLGVRGVFDGEHHFRLEELADGTTRLHHGEQFTGILVPVMGKVLADTEAGFNAFNRALAEEVQARRGVGNDRPSNCSA